MKKGSHMTPEQVENNRRAQNRPEIRAKKSKASKEVWNDPAIREQYVKSSRNRWDKKEEHEKTSKAVKAAFQEPDKKQNLIDGLTEYWNNPDFHDNLKKIHNTPEAKENHSNGSKSVWNRPGEKERRCEIAKESHNTPEYIEKQRNITTELWMQSEYRSKLSGSSHWNWKGGLSESYCSEWTPELRESIRKKFGRRCFISGKLENGRKLDVHHCDYLKSQGCQGQRWSLLPLTNSSHGKTTSGKRWYWFALLRDYWCYKYLTFHGMDIFEGPSRTEWLWDVWNGECDAC
jgi:hypothetical protein